MKKFYFSIITWIIFSILMVLALEIFVRLFYPEIPAYGTSKELYAERVYGGSSGLASGKNGYSLGVPVNVSQYGFRSCSVKIDTSKKIFIKMMVISIRYKFFYFGLVFTVIISIYIIIFSLFSGMLISRLLKENK